MCSEAVIGGVEKLCFRVDQVLVSLHLYCCHVCQKETRRALELDLLRVHRNSL